MNRDLSSTRRPVTKLKTADRSEPRSPQRLHHLSLTAVAMMIQAAFTPQVRAQGIVTDGRTQTVVGKVGNVSTVTTSTVSGTSGFNSFSSFQVGQGTVANLVLPNGTTTLVNIVSSQVSINGVVNSIKNGGIGGRVYFASSQGFIVGAQGVINTGSLFVSTPTPNFISSFFSGGSPNSGAAAQLASGTEPINPDGVISIYGQINLIDGTELRAGTVNVGASGLISAGASFNGTAPDFTDVVNAHGLVRGDGIVERDGRILIAAGSAVDVAGALGANAVEIGATSTSGGAVQVNLNGADIAGRDITVAARSTLSDATLLTTLGTRQALASAKVDVSGGRVASENGSIAINAVSEVHTSTYGTVPTSVAVLRSSSSANVDVHNGAAISTTVTAGPASGNVQIGAQSITSAVATPGSALANLNGDAMVAVTDVASTAGVRLGTTTGDTPSSVSSVQSAGSLSMTAINQVDTTATANASAAGSSAAGATVAVSKLRTTTEAIVDRGAQVTSGGALNLSASSVNNAAVVAKSTAKGAQQDTGGTGRAAQALSDYGDQAQTSEGGVKVAGAVAVSDWVGSTRAQLGANSGTVAPGSLNAAGDVTVQSLSTNVATVDANASATGGTVGVGVAVGINLGKGSNQALVGQSLGQTQGVRSLQVQADMAPNGASPLKNQFVTTVASGAGAKSVGVAGALGVNAVDLEAKALLQPDVVVAFNADGTAPLSLQAHEASVSDVAVLPTSPTAGGKVGIGASVAVNVVANRSLAEIGNRASANGAGSVALEATGDHEVNTAATAGSAGGIAITPSAAVAVVNNSATADFGIGAAITTQVVNGSSGDIALVARQTASETTTASGSATGGTAAVGAAVAVAVVNDTVLATSRRDIDGAGNVTLSASGASLGTVEATASAAGGKTSDDAGATDSSTGKKKEDASVDDKLSGLLKLGTDNQDAAGVGDTDQQAATSGDVSDGSKPSASTSEGKLAVAAAVGVNIENHKTRAVLPDELVVRAGKGLTLSSANNTDGQVTTNGATVGDAAVGIGAAVSINLVKSSNQALLGDGTGTHGVEVHAGSVTLSALKSDLSSSSVPSPARTDQYGASATSGAGSGKVGLAGSLALNLIDTESRAQLASGAAVSIVPGDTGAVSVSSDDRASTTGQALPADGGASGSKVGIGASVAVNVVAHRSIAQVQDAATITGAQDLTLRASGAFDMLTQAEAGSQGGVSITPSVAVSLANNSTTASLGTSASTLVLSGDVLVQADQASTTTTMAKGSSQGTKAAIGAAVAVALVDDQVSATTARSIDSSSASGPKGAVSFVAHGASASSASATASAVGGNTDDTAGTTDATTGKKKEDASVDDKVGNQTAFGKKAQTDSGIGDDAQKSSTASADTDKPSASSSEGKISVAAAVSVNLQKSSAKASVPDAAHVGDMVVKAHGQVTLSASNNTDGAALTDGSAVGSTTSVGIGAGISVNLVKSANEASIGRNAKVSGNGLTLEAKMTDVKGDGSDLVNTLDAEAKSGAGSSKVGLAGSLALNIADTSSQALIKTGAQVDAGGGAVSLSADDRTSTTGKALPADGGGASGGKVGIGASVAVNVIANRSIAEVQDSATLTDLGALDIAASGDHAVDTEVEAGASGGIAITPAVALAIVNNTTTARLGTGATLVNPGSVTLSVEHTSTTTTSAKGSAQGDKAAVGAAVGIVLLNDVASATLERDIDTASGAVSVSAHASSASSNTATASAVGGKSDDDAGQTDSTTGKKKEDASVDDKVSNQTAFGKKTQKDSNVGDGDQQTATDSADGNKTSASSDEGKVSVAAAVAVNIVSATATARVADGVTVKTAGALTVGASGNTDSSASSDGSTVGSTAKVGIGAAVSVNKVDAQNEASIGQNAQVTAHGVTVESTMTNVGGDTTNTIAAEAKSGAGASNVGIAASLALNLSDTSSKALIKSGAGVDAGGAVTLTAEDDSKNTATAAPTTDGGATGGKVGIGASVALNLITSVSQAQVASNAGLTHASSITLSATTQGDSDATATAGASGGKLAFDAAVAVTALDQTTDASIGAGADIGATGDVSLSATSSGKHTATTVGTAKSGSVSIGASVGVITSSSTTSATIDRNLSTDGTFGVTASSTRYYDASATASAGGSQSDDTYSQNQSQADKSASSTTLKNNQDSDTNQGTQGGGKVNIAAAVGVVAITDNVNASVTGGRTIQSGVGKAMNIAAASTSNFSARGAGDAVDPNSKVGVGIGVGLVISKGSTTASLANSTHVVQSGDLTVQAISEQNTDTAYAHKLTAEGIAGAGGSKVGVAGAFAVAYSKGTTSATIGDNSQIDDSDAVTLDAENTATLSAKAWAGAFGSVGVGASVATVISDNVYAARLGGGGSLTASSLTVQALNHKFNPTPFSLDLSNLGNMTDKDSAKNELKALGNQFTSGQLLGGGNYYTEAAAGAAGDKVAVAGSFAVNVFKDTTDASIGTGAQVSTGTGTIALTADNDTVARSLAGSLSVGGRVGVGVSSADVASTNVTRSHIDDGVQVTASGGIQLTSSNRQDIEVIGVAGGVAGNVAVSGVANVITLNNTSEAYVAPSTTTVLNSSGAFGASATNTVTGLNVASGLAVSGSVAVGVVGAVSTVGTDASHQFATRAYIGDNAKVNAATSTTLDATASQDLTTFAIAGAASGSVSVGGAAVVNVINTDTRAYLGDGAELNKAATLTSQSASLSAQDTTSLFDVVAGAAAGGSVGVGASGDVAVITKSTQAYVGSGAWAETAGNLLVQSAAAEDFRSIAIGLGVGGSAGAAGSVSVYSLTGTTLAYVDNNATLRVRGSALIAADDQSVMDLISGSASAGGSGAIGAAAGVTVFDKTTRASIGDSADVEVLGYGATGLQAATGDIAIDFGGAISGNGRVKSTLAPEDAQGGPISSGQNDAIGDRNAFQGVTNTRTATPTTSLMRGLAVTATNRDKLNSFSVTGAAGGALAVTLGGNVATLTTDTEAGIGESARINQNGTLANAGQSVRVAAGSDQYHLGLAGAAAGAGAAAVGAAADVIVADNTVKATIGKNAQVKAARDVEVLAHGQAQYLELGAGLAAAGTVAVAGSVGVISLNDTTYATIVGGTGATTRVDAGGNTRVVAGDDTETNMIAGAAAAGFGAAGFGVAVGVNSITKDSQATIGNGVTVNALGGAGTFTGYLPDSGSDTRTAAMKGLQVQATSKEDLFMVSASGAGGLYAGVSGAVTVTLVNSNTQAVIGDDAKINLTNTGASIDQDVNVTARNQLKSLAFTGSVGVGAVGLSGGVDVLTAKNNTHAGIGDRAQVHALNDVTVNALSSTDLDTVVVSASGGVAAVAAGVSVYSVGDKLGTDAQSQLSTDDGNVKDQADREAKGSALDDLLKDSDNDNVKFISAQAQAKRASVSTGAATSGMPAAGNSASIGTGAIVVSGGNVAVNARGTLTYDSTTGAAAVGALGLGAGIGIANFTLNNQASIGANAEVTADGDVLVHASLTETANGLAFAGTGGIVAVNAAWAGLTDNASTTTATIGTGAKVHRAGRLTVEALDVRTLDAQAIGASIGAVAGGASIATTEIGGTTDAHIDSGAFIGSGTTDVVGDLEVSADSRVKATSSTLAAAGGIALAATGSKATATAAPTVRAYVNGGTVKLTGDALVQAVAAAGASADALGFTVSGGVSVGASIAQARSAPRISAYLGTGTVLTADNLTVSATHELPDFVYAFDNSLDSHVLARSQAQDTTVRASATGTSGGALLGAVGTSAEADYGSLGTAAPVTASVGNGSTLTVPGTLDVTATNNSRQDVTSSGLAFGIAAIGSNDAYARSNSRTTASLGDNVAVVGGITGQTHITAQGTDTNIAQSVSGSGGVIAGAAATANTVETSDTRAAIGASTCGAPSATCGIATGSLTLSANHDTVYNGKVDSTQASLAGASGASNSHLVSSRVNVDVGDGASVTAGRIALAATNATHKYWWGRNSDVNTIDVADGAAWNVNSGSGGLLNLPAGRTVTTIDQRTNVSTGDNSLFHVLMLSGSNAFTLDANNIIVSYDKTKLDSGGAIALAESNSIINAGSAGDPADGTRPKVNAIVTLGQDSTITSDAGNIDIGSRTDAKFDARAVANAYGLAGAPSGKAYVNYVGTQTTTVGDGALLLANDPAQGKVNVAAGENSAHQASSILAHTAVNLWNKTAVPINSTPDAQTRVAQNSTLNLSANSNVLAAGDIGLAANRGNIQVSAVGVGKDLYREVAGKIASAVGIDASLDITGGIAPTPGGVAQVNANGRVLSGLLRQSATQIDPVIVSTNPDGSVVWDLAYSQVDSTQYPGLAANPLDGSLSNPYIGHLSPGQLSAGQILVSNAAPNSKLLDRLALLQGLLAKYAADPVSRSAYQAEINFLTKKLGSQGIGQKTEALTNQGSAAVAATSAVDTALADHQTLITGDITGATSAEQIGAVGSLVNAYTTINANNTTINDNLVTLKGAPTTANLSANSTYAGLTSNRSSAAASYTTLRTKTADIGNYAYSCDATAGACLNPLVGPLGTLDQSVVEWTTPDSVVHKLRTVSGSGYLGAVQQTMDNISLLALRRAGATGDLPTSIAALSGQMDSIKSANASIVSSAANIFSQLSAASSAQATLSGNWRDTAGSGNVDTGRVTTISNALLANSPTTGLVAQFNASTTGTAANVVSTQAGLVADAAAAIASSVATVTAADNTPAAAGSQKVLTFPDISVKLGNVNVRGDVLAGTGSLEAPGDGKIWILNNSPASMKIGNLTVDSTGGNVRLNGFLVNNTADVRRFNPSYSGPVPTIMSRENGVVGANGLLGQPEIRIVSTYDPGAYDPASPDVNRRIPAAAPDITIAYRDTLSEPSKLVSNPNGLVSVSSDAGDIYVDGSITAGSVAILAKNGDFVQSYVNGFNSVAGEPNANIQGGDGVLDPNKGKAPGPGIVANGNVFISARYLNINGLVQSGIVNYRLDIPVDADLRFLKADKTTVITKAQADLEGLKVDLYNPTGDASIIGATYDPLTNTITMTSTAKVHGGNITLFGQIINTADGGTGGAGKLAVLDGFGQVAINNLSSAKLVLKTIDTGADPDPANPGRGTVGTIDITDVQSVDVVNGAAVVNAIHTVISRDQDAITVKQTGYWNADGTFNPGEYTGALASTANLSLTDIQNSQAIQNSPSRVTTQTVRLGTYDPQAGLRYIYTNGSDTSTKYQWRFSGASFFGTSSLSLPPDNVSRTLTSGPNVLSNYPLPNGTFLSYVKPAGLTTAHANQLVADPTGATSTQATKQTSQSHTTSSVYTKVDEWNDCNWWTLCIASRYTSIWDQVTGTTAVTSNSVKADYPIRVEFLGANTALLTVNSGQEVSLAAQNQLNNRYGDTTITAKSFSAGASSLIDTRNLTITANNGSIGADGSPVNVLVGGALTASASAGNVNINQIAGALKVATVSATGDATAGQGKVVLSAQGDLYGDAGNLIRAQRIELSSSNGAIGGIAGHTDARLPLNIQSGYTADRGNQPFYGLKASAAGDIGIDEQVSAGNVAGHLLVDTVTSLGGDVRLTAPGRILDNNPEYTLDTRTWDQLRSFWDSVTLRAGAANDQKVAQALRVYETGRTQDYAQYWQIRTDQHAPSTFDASWRYTATAAERATLADAGAITAFENARTERYWALSAQIAGYDAQALARGAAAALLKQAHPSWTQDQIAAQVRADAAAGTLPSVTAGARVAGFVYVASAAEQTAQATGSTWTTSQLALGVNSGLLKDVTDTNPVIKAPNASGRHVTLVAGTSIGSTLEASDPEAVVIALNTDGNLTDREKVALATAEFSDFVFSDPARRTGTLTISQRLPVNFSATTGVSASVNQSGNSANPLTQHVVNTDTGNIYLASLGAAPIDQIRADGEVRLKVKGAISAVDVSRAAITAGDLILEAANATIGGNADGSTPLWVDVKRDAGATADSYGSVTARGVGRINLIETGDFAIGGIFSRGAITVESSTGSVVNARPDDNPGLVLLGGTVQITASQGSIGNLALDQALAVGSNIGTPLSGLIQAQAGGSIFLEGPSNPLVASNFTLGAVIDGADAVHAGDRIRIVARENGTINGNVVAPGAIELVGDQRLTLSGTRDIEIGDPNSLAGTSTQVASAAAVHSLSGNITMTADELRILDDATVRADTGTVRFDTTGDAIVTGISTGNATANAVRGQSSNGRILDGGDVHLDITANQTGAVMTLSAQNGVGTGTLRADGSIDATTANPLEIDVASAAAVAVTGNLNLSTQGLLNLTSASAPGDINLFGRTGVIAGSIVSTGGGITVNAPNGSIVTQQVQAATRVVMNAGQDITAGHTAAPVVEFHAQNQVSAGTIDVSSFFALSGQTITGTIDNTSTHGLHATVSGPDGAMADAVTLDIVNPNSVVFDFFSADLGELNVSGPGAVAVQSGVLGTRLNVLTPLTQLVVDSRNNGLEDVDIKLYAPGHDLNFSLLGRSLVTTGYVLQRRPEFMTDSPAGRDVTLADALLDEIAKAQAGSVSEMPQPKRRNVSGPVEFSSTPLQLNAGGATAVDATSPSLPELTEPRRP